MATEPSSVRQQLQHPAAVAAEPKAVWQSVGNVSGQAVTFKGIIMTIGAAALISQKNHYTTPEYTMNLIVHVFYLKKIIILII